MQYCKCIRVGVGIDHTWLDVCVYTKHGRVEHKYGELYVYTQGVHLKQEVHHTGL